ncbi:hypothetical protein [Mycolicibacterium fortuitum]|uniref:hypothetical protein n=1 Tax=Mycolicibacterium fortuitum TaxID=1766 RepID=UPI00241FFD5B|nr:hypothetical protein [Mycolicibacterium fortuitum]MDG5772367.1 hypothetical protein [Mycolicibacterium fortuitum]MDG5782630.1 hypothetical protein [Mycolicibacterium fortuitum]
MTTDVARAARLAAAMAADDIPGVGAVIKEAKQADGLVGLALALAAQHITVCAEFYDTDCQKMLDTFAMDAMNMGTSE